MQNLENVYDYYNKEFKFSSIKGNEEYKLKVFTNFSIVGNLDFTDNATLAYFNEDDIRIYLGSSSDKNDKLDVIAHEYTHGYFRTIVQPFDDKETDAVNEAYSDIMGMIIEAYYGDLKLDGIHDKDGGSNCERIIKNSELKYTDFNEEMEEHEASMIISKVAYLMSANENLNLNINDLADLWFNALYKLPKHIVTFDDVERAVLLQAVELGYSETDIREMANIFVSLGYPDYYEECTKDKVFNTRKVEKLDVEQAVSLVKENFGDWKGIEVDYEYVATMMDEDKNIYYAINAYAHENYMYLGGEWLAEITDGRYYAGTYYVCDSYTRNIVHVGYNPRDYEKYTQGDTIVYFLEDHHIKVD